jgi:hypothetical protein
MRKLGIALGLLSFLAIAQSERGNLTGIVTDPTGAAIAGAELIVVHRDTNASTRAVATQSGEYNVPNLLPGVYRLEVTLRIQAVSATEHHDLSRNYRPCRCAAATRAGDRIR